MNPASIMKMMKAKNTFTANHPKFVSFLQYAFGSGIPADSVIEITVTKPGFIYLTDKGREVAEMIYERHELLTSWLIQLGVDEKTAAEDACRMEHDISKETFQAIKKYITDNN